MVKSIVLARTAAISYAAIVEYLVEHWSVSVANDFIERFGEAQKKLIENTEIFSFANKTRRIQKCVLTKHNIIYFKATKTQIKIVAIFDTRQDPKKLMKFL